MGRLASIAVTLGLLLGCRPEPDPLLKPLRPRGDTVSLSTEPSVSTEPIGALPPAPGQPPELAALGRELFFSTIVSGDGQVSCASCHRPEHGFTDARGLSSPAGRPEPLTNTPTILNVAYLDMFNWNGKFGSLDEHLDALIQNPRIQDTSWPSIGERLKRSEEWPARFESIFSDGVSGENARAALLAYERSLVSPGAPFDRWLAGDREAISNEAREGYALFKSRGCVSCHQGALVGGNLFQRLGIMKPYFADAERVREGDLGRFAVTGREEDRHVFRVPSLRNVALTAPYLHDGSQPTLETTISVMATYQLGRDFDPEQVARVVSFLETLTGSSPTVLP